MKESYILKYESGNLVFIKEDIDLPENFFDGKNSSANKDFFILGRLGDDSLLETIVYKWRDKSGGIFAINIQDKVLFIAVANDNLTFALGLGYFGKICSNAKYGQDIFESMD